MLNIHNKLMSYENVIKSNFCDIIVMHYAYFDAITYNSTY